MIRPTLHRSVPRRTGRFRGNESMCSPSDGLTSTLVRDVVLGTSETYGNTTMVDEGKESMDLSPCQNARATQRPTWASCSNSVVTNDDRTENARTILMVRTDETNPATCPDAWERSNIRSVPGLAKTWRIQCRPLSAIRGSSGIFSRWLS